MQLWCAIISSSVFYSGWGPKPGVYVSVLMLCLLDLFVCRLFYIAGVFCFSASSCCIAAWDLCITRVHECLWFYMVPRIITTFCVCGPFSCDFVSCACILFIYELFMGVSIPSHVLQESDSLTFIYGIHLCYLITVFCCFVTKQWVWRPTLNDPFMIHHIISSIAFLSLL